MEKNIQKTNPVPLGLLGAGVVTIFFSMHNSGLITPNVLLLGIGLFYGSLMQIIAGAVAWRNNDTFGTTVFIGYGFFWFSIVALLLIPKFGWAEHPDSLSMTVYFAMWAGLTAIIFIGTLKLGKIVQIVFALLTFLFILLAAAQATGMQIFMKIAGYEGIITGILALYIAFAELTNEIHDKKIFPI